MSRRVDRALGTKPYNNAPRRLPAPPRWSFTFGRALKWMLIAILLAGAYAGLKHTSDCQPGIRCAD